MVTHLQLFHFLLFMVRSHIITKRQNQILEPGGYSITPGSGYNYSVLLEKATFSQ